MESHSKISNCTIYRYLYANIHLPNFLSVQMTVHSKIMAWSIVGPLPGLLHFCILWGSNMVHLFVWRYMWGRHNNIGFHIVQPVWVPFHFKEWTFTRSSFKSKLACLAHILDLSSPPGVTQLVWLNGHKVLMAISVPKDWFKLCTPLSDADVIVSLKGDMICLASVISISNLFYRISALVECWKCAVSALKEPKPSLPSALIAIVIFYHWCWLELIPVDDRQEAGYTLDRSLVHHRALTSVLYLVISDVLLCDFPL